MFYRRKILLSLIEIAGKKIEKIRLQKLLFLFCQEQEKPVYHFVPYHYGCYSFTSVYDLEWLVKQNLLSETQKHFHIAQKTNYKDTISKSDRICLENILKKYNHLSTSKLIQYTYRKYPYYASKSKIAKNILKINLDLNSEQNDDFEHTLFTIGYEGLTIEAYLNKLIQNNIKSLIDVRNNPFSMKWGFSKSELAHYCKKMSIIYMHIPEAGIPSHKRKTLSSQQDYDTLFEEYKNEVLTQTASQQKKILNIVQKYKKVAITCFEANVCQCHRKHLAEQLKAISPFELQIKHI